MAAALYDIIVEEKVDLVLQITWFDSTGSTVDVSGYGAEFVLKKNKDRHSDPFVVITHNATASGQISVNANPGEFLVRVDQAVLSVLDFERGYYQLVVHPTAADPTSNPIRLLQGQFRTDISLY